MSAIYKLKQLDPRASKASRFPTLCCWYSFTEETQEIRTRGWASKYAWAAASWGLPASTVSSWKWRGKWVLLSTWCVLEQIKWSAAHPFLNVWRFRTTGLPTELQHAWYDTLCYVWSTKMTSHAQGTLHGTKEAKAEVAGARDAAHFTHPLASKACAPFQWTGLWCPARAISIRGTGAGRSSTQASPGAALCTRAQGTHSGSAVWGHTCISCSCFILWACAALCRQAIGLWQVRAESYDKNLRTKYMLQVCWDCNAATARRLLQQCPSPGEAGHSYDADSS